MLFSSLYIVYLGAQQYVISSALMRLSHLLYPNITIVKRGNAFVFYLDSRTAEESGLLLEGKYRVRLTLQMHNVCKNGTLVRSYVSAPWRRGVA